MRGRMYRIVPPHSFGSHPNYAQCAGMTPAYVWPATDAIDGEEVMVGSCDRCASVVLVREKTD